MFTPKEIKFLKTELNTYVEKVQQRLDKPDLDESLRERIEDRLIVIVSILNKLGHAEPEKEVKSTLFRVLIVDDTESMRQINRHYFMECGFKNVDVAEEGERAFKMMKQAYKIGKPYKLVISDWEMPKMTGIELLKMTRTDKELWQTPFYLITTLSDKKYIVQAINKGVTGYMVKPVNQKMVNDKFSDYLEC